MNFPRDHWVNKYVNRPWAAYRQGPDLYDCTGLVIRVQRYQFLRLVPMLDRASMPALTGPVREGRWVKHPNGVELSDGDIVISRAGGHNRCGVIVDIDGDPAILRAFSDARKVVLNSPEEDSEAGHTSVSIWTWNAL